MCYDKFGFFAAVCKDDGFLIKGILEKIFIMLTITYIASCTDGVVAIISILSVTLISKIYKALNVQPYTLFPFICSLNGNYPENISGTP